MQFYLDRKFYGTHKADPKNKPIALHVVMLKKEQFVKKKKKKKKRKWEVKHSGNHMLLECYTIIISRHIEPYNQTILISFSKTFKINILLNFM